MKRITVAAALLLSSLSACMSENWVSSGDPEVDAWYRKVLQEVGGSCCGLADAYWGQLTKVQDDGVLITVEDDRVITGRKPRDGEQVFVPNKVLDHQRQGNPTGHIVVFVGVDNRALCLFMGEGI